MEMTIKLNTFTVRHETFTGTDYFCGMANFCVLWELIYCDWDRLVFLNLLGIILCDSQQVASKWIVNIFDFFIKYVQSKYTADLNKNMLM